MGDYGVIVLGTGAAGLTAAATAAELGATVGLFEEGATLGGTTVSSGGMIWIPLNQHEPAEKGDSRGPSCAGRARTRWPWRRTPATGSGDVITGLYAAGNAMASPRGMAYGGSGETLGPAMVFGHLAGRDIAQRVAAKTPPAPAASHGGA